MKQLLVAIALSSVIAIALRSSSVNAELDNQIFTSRTHRLRLVIPRGWRATDQPSYPGLLVWMMRSQPEGKMVLSAEPFTRQVYCSWPIECRTSVDSLPGKLACAMRTKLTAQHLTVGLVQAGPRENEQAGIPSVWFDINDGKNYVRQAVALDEDRVVSLVLSASSEQARAAHVRAFEQALRTLRPLTPQELGEPLPAPQQVVSQLITNDASVPADATVVPADAAIAAPATAFAAPIAKIDPVGPCTKP